ncbi:MAG: hypothetical protein ACO1O6_14085 [Bacteroidota bacterium]
MTTSKLALYAFAAILVAACGVSKTGEVSATTTTTTTTTTTPATTAKSENGIYEPGEEELKAIRAQYPDVTLDKLKEGYVIYTMGECIQCHNAKNIYKRDVSEWPHIIDNMSEMAKISAEKKDAVSKFVMAIKATQPKG